MSRKVERCAICGERLRASQEVAEMHDPKALELILILDKGYKDMDASDAGLVHGECGFSHGWEMS